MGACTLSAIDWAALDASPVFKGIPSDEGETLLNAVGAYLRVFEADAVIRAVGDELKGYPVVLEGSVQAALPRDGSLQIVSRFGPGDSFAEAVPTTLQRSPVQITALERCLILMIPAANLTASGNPWAAQLVSNLMGEMSKKIEGLSKKLRLLGEPKLRRRLLMYLADLQVEEDGWVSLPFKYRELAEYLGVTKASFSRELQRMQEEGILRADRRSRRMLVLKPLDEEGRLCG